MIIDKLTEKYGEPLYEISHRGGYLGYSDETVAGIFDVPVSALPGRIGAWCNYLGGGIRGSICHTSESDLIAHGVPEHKAHMIETLARRCASAYRQIEDDAGLNDDEYPDGDTNWDSLATKASRRAGTKSAY